MDQLMVRCKNCGADTIIDSERSEGYCAYCGSRLINDQKTKTVRIVTENTEKHININVNKDIAKIRQFELEHEKLKMHYKNARRERRNRILASFFVLLFTVLTFIAMLYILVEYSTSRNDFIEFLGGISLLGIFIMPIAIIFSWIRFVHAISNEQDD